ncbi:hypothetical protein FCIRC_10635 [Fusarium circinatum]|uniref:2EXR domain-containing protein n=1 Tax=Fusarium circinatum TaxID=48490 RepID=A0A8H5T8R4_FUSCI|nr:hypothetical protein FCIRC_10635 [Fusarium circinatum]
MALESFHRMMDLPLEIRQEIYFMATPDRVVHIRSKFPDLGKRKGRFSCSTLIPPLLHTFSESREFLERTGYRLAFRDKSIGRQFWFNFKRDTMFIDKEALDLMHHGINPFPFSDCQRVRRIAYEREDIRRYEQGVRLALQTFGELQAVFLIEWHRKVIDLHEPRSKSSEGFFPDLIPQRHSYDTRNLCKFTEIQKIDAYICWLPRFEDLQGMALCMRNRWETLHSVVPPLDLPKDTDIAKYLSEPYEKWRDHRREELELNLAKYWAKLGRPKAKLPKFKVVHLLTDDEYQRIRQERRIYSEKIETKFHKSQLSELINDNLVPLASFSMVLHVTRICIQQSQASDTI